MDFLPPNALLFFESYARALNTRPDSTPELLFGFVDLVWGQEC